MKLSLARVKFSDDMEGLCVCVDGEYYLDENGAEWKPSQIKGSSRVRGIPQAVKEEFFNVARAHIARKKEDEKYEQARLEYIGRVRELSDAKSKALAALRAAQGKLSENEFVNVFYDSLSPEISNQMEKSDYRAEIEHVGFSCKDRTLRVERNVMIGKYMRRLPFVYEEYDGNLFMEDNAEKSPEYRNYVRKYRIPLSVKSKLGEHLYLGDKDSLHYCGVYEMKLDPRRDLTRDYAAEIAKKFCA